MRASLPITRSQTAGLVTRLRERTIPRLTADFARRKLAEVQGSNPRPFKQIVDGREGGALDSVRTGGNIRFLFADIGPVLDWLYEELVIRSPVGPERGQPHYRDVHWLFIDGERVEVPGVGANAQISGRSIARFVNTRPYAAKIERGFSFQAPDGVYELTAMEAARRFPFALIEFDYTEIDGLPYRYPRITVSARER